LESGAIGLAGPLLSGESACTFTQVFSTL